MHIIVLDMYDGLTMNFTFVQLKFAIPCDIIIRKQS